MFIKTRKNCFRMRFFLAISCLLFVTSCSKRMEIRVKAHENLNQGYPVVLRVYQLKNDTNFQHATIQSFWLNDRQVLGEELVDKKEYSLQPGQVIKLKVNIEDETKFIGACADFNQPDMDGWRGIRSLASLKGKEVWIVCGENKLQIVER